MNGIKRLFGAQDMTVGNPLSCLLKFSIPLLIGNVAQLLYGTVDAVVVGKVVGDTALSAIGASSPIQNLFFVLFMTIATGASVMVSQYFGAKDGESLSMTIGNSITLIFIASVIITAVGLPLAGPILRLTKTPAETFDMARSYLMILFGGVIGIGFYNILSGILRGMGESVFPLIVLLCTCALNIVLDIWFVSGLGLGVAGAAWATIIAQIISAVILLIKVMRLRGLVHLKAHMLIPNRAIMKDLLRLGIPAGITQGIMSLSFVFVQSLINAMGYLVTACCTAVMRVDGFAMLPNQTFSNASSTFTGQNIGAGRLDRVKQGGKTGMLLSLSVSAVLVAFILVFGRSMLMLFTDTPEVISMGVRMMRIMSVGYLCVAVGQTFGGIMRGAGDTMASMWITIATMVVVRIPLVYLLASLTKSAAWPAGDPVIIPISMLVIFILNSAATSVYYSTGRWKTKAVVKHGFTARD